MNLHSCIFALLLLVSSVCAAVSPEFLGAHFHDAGKKPLTLDAAVGSIRLWDARIGWNYLEPAQGKWNFSVLDQAIADAAAAKLEILLPLGLTPAWAATEPARLSAYGPGNSSPPSRLVDWEAYVRAVVTRYKGRVAAYEIWNEPNRERFFSGSSDSLFRLTCSASRIIREIDPSAKVVSSAPTDQGKGVDWLDDYLSRPVGRCVDAVGFHFYTLAHEPPEAIVALIEAARQVLQKRGLAHLPLWNTEFGWYIENARVPNTIRYRKLDPPTAMNYLLRSYILQASLGIERSYHYSWNSSMMGVIEPDTGEAKVVVDAIRAARRWLVGADTVRCAVSEALVQCTVDGQHRRRLIYWTRGGTQYVNVPMEFIGGRLEAPSGEVSVTARKVLIDEMPRSLEPLTSKAD